MFRDSDKFTCFDRLGPVSPPWWGGKGLAYLDEGGVGLIFFLLYALPGSHPSQRP